MGPSVGGGWSVAASAAGLLPGVSAGVPSNTWSSASCSVGANPTTSLPPNATRTNAEQRVRGVAGLALDVHGLDVEQPATDREREQVARARRPHHLAGAASAAAATSAFDSNLFATCDGPSIWVLLGSCSTRNVP